MVGSAGAAALRFAADGACVCVADLRGDKAAEVADEIVKAGGRAFGCQVDVKLEADNLRMVEQTKQHFGAVHCGFLNAGIARQGGRLRLARQADPVGDGERCHLGVPEVEVGEAGGEHPGVGKAAEGVLGHRRGHG